MSGKILTKWDLDTPALLIDIDLLQANIQTMADYFRTVKAKLRPHVKTHKIPIIAHMQIEAGAIGVTCQKLGEAEVFAQAGIKGILLTNQIAGEQKIRRFIQLSRWADVTVGVDNLEVAQQISDAAVAAQVTAKVAVEIWMGRCGVAPGEPALNFVKKLVQLPGLKFMGLWEHLAGNVASGGNIAAEKSWAKRKEATVKDLESFLESKHLIEQSGIPVEIFSGGYTATYDITAEFPEITDVQAGSYVFMDWPYRELEGMERFQQAVSVLTTVISKPPHQPDVAYTDCGLKNISVEHTADYGATAFPKIKGELGEQIQVIAVSEEHGWLKGAVNKLKVGDKIELIPSHCCTTTSRYDEAYVVSGERVVGIWPVSARGRHS